VLRSAYPIILSVGGWLLGALIVLATMPSVPVDDELLVALSAGWPGTLSADQFTRSESAMIRSRGHCNTMGTASTMALVAKALGMVVPGVAGTPAADSRLLEAAHGTGRLVVEMVAADRRPSTLLTHASFANAIVTMAASAGPPTPWSTCWRSPGGSGSTSRSTISMALVHASRCWSICSRPIGS
jgi:dihydroxyacid dehydratase/phosphogluconate dehydratase